MDDHDLSNSDSLLERMEARYQHFAELEGRLDSNDPYFGADLANLRARHWLGDSLDTLTAEEKADPILIRTYHLEAGLREAVENLRNTHATTLVISRQKFEALEKSSRSMRWIVLGCMAVLVWIALRL